MQDSHKNLTVYAVPTWNCNLRCSHCFVRNNDENQWNEQAFISTLNSLPDSAFVVLHGGEPTLYKDRLEAVLATNRVRSITTNLVIPDDRIEIINKSGISVATSWNPSRFSEAQYELWLTNLRRLDRPCRVLITMTSDLLDMGVDAVLSKLQDMYSTGKVDEILFEPLIIQGDRTLALDLKEKYDRWLIEMHNRWQFPNMDNVIAKQIGAWVFNCHAKTLQPNGALTDGCLMASDMGGERKLLPDCLTCKMSAICRPCKLQGCCSFYPKFYEYIKTKGI